MSHVEAARSVEPDEKYYVYHLVDPRSDAVFYVGKGSGNRIAHHERDARKLKFANSEKEAMIHEIWASGLSVKRMVVRRFDKEAAAFTFEKQEIARIGIENLTNLSRGGESEAVRAMRRGEAFIARLSSVMHRLSGKGIDDARMLIKEMEENIGVCRRIIYGPIK